MCGIAGFVDFGNRSSPEILSACTTVLSHRGPDGYGTEFFNENHYQVGLGHRRLSVIDLSENGKQPMHYKQWYIVYNGEIYNYNEIKNDLIALGHQFVSNSDTEVILHAWEEWGDAMLHKFIGMFAAVIYDKAAGQLTVIRDRAGVKPLYYYWKNGLFLFASELKSFHQHPLFSKEINKQALHQFLQYGYIIAPLSIFNYTFKLIPGNYLTFQLEKKELSVVKYWDVYDYYNQPKLKISKEDAITETERLLSSAAEYRMIADVPVGVFLSGGYDSTVVTALLQKDRTQKIKTFTIGFFEEDYNEAGFAKKVAAHLGTDHTEYYCTANEAKDIIPQIPFYCDEPFGDSSFIPTMLVSKLAKKSVTVALSADAGDETFAGYNKYPMAIDLLGKINSIPPFMRTIVGHLLTIVPGKLLAALVKNPAATIKQERFADALKAGDINIMTVMDQFMSQLYSDKQMDKLLHEMTPKPVSFFSSFSALHSTVGNLDKMLAVDYKTYMPDDILVKVDRAGMSTSLESREPLLDHRLIQFAACLPENCKLKGNTKKFILRELVHKYVPPSLMDRPKMGFGVPVFKWLREDLRFYADEYLSDAALDKHGLLNKLEVHHIKQQFFLGDRNYNSVFWYLLMFQMWYKQWMD